MEMEYFSAKFLINLLHDGTDKKINNTRIVNFFLGELSVRSSFFPKVFFIWHLEWK